MVEQLLDPRQAEKNICYCCGKKNISDQHHIIPCEYGGPKSGTTVPLCPTCHRSVHREGEYRFKNQDKGKFINYQEFSNPIYYQRADLLANYILQSKLQFILKGKSKADDSRNMIQVSFTNEELRMVHALKRDLGFTSLPKLIKYLIQDKISSI